MTLVEALKKNKPLRRPISKHMGSGDGYLAPEYIFSLLICGQIRRVTWIDDVPNTIKPILIGKQDILADDWEVKDETS